MAFARSQYLPSLNNSLQESREDIIKHYFYLGFEYSEIASFLHIHHGHTISTRHLKRILKHLGLKRRKFVPSSPRTIVSTIETEFLGSGNCLGYRQMHQRLVNDHHINVDRETVRLALRVLDPSGVSRRQSHRMIRRKYRSKGPNYAWHIDGYDKLKPFGFCVHGCIDGYSRRIMWLKVASTNNNPAVVSQYYLDCVKTLKAVPRLVRADHGTENVNIEVLQQYFHDDNGESFRYGKSVANQRIEAWWSQLRKSNADYWIKYFKDLRDSGLFDDSDVLESSCLKFCFMGLLQEELDRVTRHWNTHRIRRCHNQETVPGRPDVLYFLSQSRGIQDYKVPIDMEDVEVAGVMAEAPLPFGCLREFTDVFLLLMQENGLVMPNNVEDAEDLYVRLVQLTSNAI